MSAVNDAMDNAVDIAVNRISGIEHFLKDWVLNLGKMLPDIVIKAVLVIVCLFVGTKIIKLLIAGLKKIMQMRDVDPLLQSFMASLIKTLLNVVLFFIIIGIIGVRATSLITVLGTAGLAVGLALQGSLANLAGGVLILLFKPFAKGDYISTNGIEGIVDQIHMLNSILVTLDNKVIVIPNGQLANNAITNFSRKPMRRLDLEYSVSYDTSIDKALEVMNKVAADHPKILQDQPMTIRLFRHNASSLDFVFRVWVRTEDYWNVMFDCNELVKKAFDANNIEIPYQKIDIYNK